VDGLWLRGVQDVPNLTNILEVFVKKILLGSAVLIAASVVGSASGAGWTECQLIPNSQCPGAELSGKDGAGKDMHGAQMRDGNLSKANFSKANLSGANIFHGNLKDGDFSEANMSNVILYNADASGANFAGANLSGAKLKGANLSGANLTDADLTNAEIEHAKFVKTTFCRTTMPNGIVNSGPNCSATKPGKRAATNPDAKSNTEYLQDLEALGRLKEKGILTEQEFQEKKKEILDRM
jgi:uncharacterized protein YjbI with pentapeptide repeats